MQVKSEMQATPTKSTPVRKNFQKGMLRGDVQSNGQDSTLVGKSRPKRRNRQKKKTNGRNESTTPKRQIVNVDSPNVAIGQKTEPEKELRRSPLKGIKTLLQGSPRSKDEMRPLQVLPHTRPPTPCPSRKSQGKERNRKQGTPDQKEIMHQHLSSVSPGLSDLQVFHHNPIPDPTGYAKAASRENLNPRKDTNNTKPVNRNQKKRKNRKRGKRDRSPGEKANVQGEHAQIDSPVKYEGCPPPSNVTRMSPLHVSNRPPPIPTIAFEVKSDADFSSKDGSSSIRILEQEMLHKIDRNEQKDAVDKPPFSGANGVVRILQNKNRGMDVGSTQTRIQQQQKSVAQVSTSAPAGRVYRSMESEYQTLRMPSFNGSERTQSEVARIRESETTVGNLHRPDCHGPSPGASTVPIRTRVSSQDVRHNDGGTHRVRRTARKPGRKPFQKKKGQ